MVASFLFLKLKRKVRTPKVPEGLAMIVGNAHPLKGEGKCHRDNTTYL